jgi:protein phosphatase PTC2/3
VFDGLCLVQEVKTTIVGVSVSVEPRQFVPIIRSGSFADIGPRRYMEDEHIRIDDLSGHLGSLLMPRAFYGVFTVNNVQLILIVI